MKILFTVLIFLVAVVTSYSVSSSVGDCVEVEVLENEKPSLLPHGMKFQLVWNDEFNGSVLDSTKWRYRTEFWGRDAFWYAKPEDNAVELKDGKAYLKIVKKEDGQFVSPQLQTGYLVWDYVRTQSNSTFWPIGQLRKPLFKHRYGYYECCCRLQQMPGWWSAFWMQSESQGTTYDPEYAGVEHDIMESFVPGEVTISPFHYNGCGPDHVMFSTPRKGDYSGNGSKKLDKDIFHVFGLLWEPDGYTVYIDGVKRGPKVGQGKNEVVSKVPEFILLTTECKDYRANNCTGHAVPELVDAYESNDAFIVDYVRVFDIVAD